MTSLIKTTSITDPAWQKATAGLVGALFTSKRWWQAMGAEYGFSPKVDFVGDFDAALAWERVDDARGSRIRSLPFCDLSCGPTDEATWPVLLAGLGESNEPGLVWSLFDGATPNGWEKDQPSTWQGLEITQGRDEIRASLRSTHRNRLNCSEREGFKAEVSSSPEAVDLFYDLHLGTRKARHQLLPQGRSLFHHQLDAFGDDLRVVSIERDGEATAAAVTIFHDGVLYYKYSASSPQYRQLGVNVALVFGLIELGLELEARLVDLGRSDLDNPGLANFKAGFRPTSFPLFRYQRKVEPSSQASEFGGTLGRLTELLVDPEVPDRVTEAAGSELYKYFA